MVEGLARTAGFPALELILDVDGQPDHFSDCPLVWEQQPTFKGHCKPYHIKHILKYSAPKPQVSSNSDVKCYLQVIVPDHMHS